MHEKKKEVLMNLITYGWLFQKIKNKNYVWVVKVFKKLVSFCTRAG